VLNNRLNTFSDEFLLLNENQTGFIALDAFSARLTLFFLKDPVL
jgi:hypothetical protein